MYNSGYDISNRKKELSVYTISERQVYSHMKNKKKGLYIKSRNFFPFLSLGIFLFLIFFYTFTETFAANNVYPVKAVNIRSSESLTAQNPSLTQDFSTFKEHGLTKNSRLSDYIWHSEDKESSAFKVFIYEALNPNGRTVCIDPGHGENNHPAATLKKEKVYPVPDSRLINMNTSKMGENAYDYGVEARTFPNVYDRKETEPEYTLKLALIIKDKLLAKGYKVVLTRNNASQNLSNGARSVLAGETSDIMISLHTNASGGNAVSGTLGFYPGDKDYMSGETYPGYTEIMNLQGHRDDSRKLAELVTQNLAKESGFTYKGTHSAVLRIFSYSSIPTCLIEVGFSDEINDAKRLIENKEETAEGIIKGIEDYYAYKERQ